MFLSYQTHKGLQITAYSIIETVMYLFGIRVSFVLTERFNQDVL